MYFAAYHFDGDPDVLQAGYERLLAAFPPAVVLLNLSIARPGGITVYDACPTQEEFTSFSTGEEFTSALAAAGLPSPRIEPLGEVRSTHGTALVPPG